MAEVVRERNLQKPFYWCEVTYSSTIVATV